MAEKGIRNTKHQLGGGTPFYDGALTTRPWIGLKAMKFACCQVEATKRESHNEPHRPNIRRILPRLYRHEYVGRLVKTSVA